ncbi:ubiquitin-related domain-containing protein [Infundibulicybe gibba]|nr:ubiquitin-related domain-containing protein [Infundibulicybe gibba]
MSTTQPAISPAPFALYESTSPGKCSDLDTTTMEASAPSNPDSTIPSPMDTIPQIPHTSITFLLVSGRRRTMSFELQTTVGRVKELVWNAWPEDWQDERPPAPAHLRVLHLGRILQDEDSLAKLKFPAQAPSTTTPPTSTIVHLSIRSYLPPGEDGGEKKGKKGRRRITSEGPAHQDEVVVGRACGCVIC